MYGSRAHFLVCDSHPGRESCATMMGLMLVAGMDHKPYLHRMSYQNLKGTRGGKSGAKAGLRIILRCSCQPCIRNCLPCPCAKELFHEGPIPGRQ